MNRRTAYERALRAIGQALENQEFKVVDVKPSGDNYVVRGDPEKVAALQNLLAKWQGRRLQNKGAFKINYTLGDIAKLDYKGRARRSAPNRTPDFHSLSTFLRTVGAYLDGKGARLLQIHKRDKTVIILYQGEQGHPQIEERTVASFYALFSEMHRRRQKAQM